MWSNIITNSIRNINHKRNNLIPSMYFLVLLAVNQGIIIRVRKLEIYSSLSKTENYNYYI